MDQEWGFAVKLYSVQFSAGLSSWLAAKRIAAKHGTDALRLLFCDTIIEDEDAYRFLVQAAANVFGISPAVVNALAATAADLPTVESKRLDERKAALAAMRAQAVSLIPGLTWIADGRTPWEVYRDERFMGNSRIAPCSRVLKQELSDRWHRENCDPATTIRVLGLIWSEQHRIELSIKALAGWTVEFPMDNPPYLVKVTSMQAALDCGIKPPRLYYLGFPHNNCGGFCCRFGQASAANLHYKIPARFGYHAEQEAEFATFIGKPVSMLTDRRGGKKKILTLQQFRQRLDAGEMYDVTDRGACSCFVNDTEEAA